MTSAYQYGAKQYKGTRSISIYKRNGDKSFTFLLTQTFEIFYFCSFCTVIILKVT